jgi:hypothetical protein
MKARWLVAAVALTAALLYGLGFVAGAEPPKATAPTFTIGGVSVDGKDLIVRFKPVFAAGNVGAWDPEAAAKLIARLVVIGPDGVPSWTIYIPGLTAKDGPIPPPPPPPPPPPGPDKPVLLLLIHETKNDTRLQALIINDKRWMDAANAAKCRWLVYDPDEGASHFPNATKAALARGIPAIVWIDSKSVPTVVPLPPTPEAMEALVKAAVSAKEKKP